MENMKRLLEFVKPRTGERLSFSSKQYYVSDDGRVWNGDLNRYLKQQEKKKYMSVDLFDNEGKKHSTIGVHNLIATCYIRLLEQGENVHHIDHNPKNNHLSNLEIIDASEHHRMHWKDGTMNGVKDNLRQISIEANPPKQIAQLSLDGRLVKVWPSTAETGRNGFCLQTVSRCCKGELKKHHGFRWMWYEDFLKKQEKEEAQQLELSFSE